MAILSTGDSAPDFSLEDQGGNIVNLSGLRGKKVLVYFYPKALTPGCTAQSCAVRDSRDTLAVDNVVCIGISPDPAKDQKRFASKYSLDFPLLSDVDHAVAEAWGVWGEKSMYGKTYMGIVRSAFLVDEEGTIVNAWYKISPADTVPRVMEALRS